MGIPTLTAVQQERDRRCFRRFKKRVWWMPQPLLEGIHSAAVGDRLTRAVEDFKQGRSTFLCILEPFRHGKSDDISRAFPAFALGALREYQPDIIMASYSAELSETFSRKVKQIVASPAYSTLYPDITIDPLRNAINQWAISKSAGEISAVGVRGSITGKGGHIIIGDDFFKSREEAESERFRDKTWEGLCNDILTRRAPVSIVIICATPWHEDDQFGRIRKKMAEDPDFPQFEFMRFPAESEDYPTGYLFPERFEPQWYRSQRATLGRYASAGLLDCDPQAREGNIFKTENVEIIDVLPTGLRFRRGWDVASTEKQRAKDDPDYTVGVKATCTFDAQGALHVWVADAKFLQAEAPERNRVILQTQAEDGPGVEIRIESVAGYKDTYTTIKNLLRGKAIVRKVGAVIDKVSKLSFLEAPFESGHVHLLRGPWNDKFLAHFRAFPKGVHDDACDGLYAAIDDFSKHISLGFDRQAIGF